MYPQISFALVSSLPRRIAAVYTLLALIFFLGQYFLYCLFHNCTLALYNPACHILQGLKRYIERQLREASSKLKDKCRWMNTYKNKHKKCSVCTFNFIAIVTEK